MKTKYQSGIHTLSINDYHNSQGYSRSQLLDLRKNPKLFYYNNLTEEKEQKEPSEAMRIGEVLHLMTLEPHLLNKHVAVQPELDRRTKAGKEEYTKFLEDNATKVWLPQHKFEECEAMAKSLKDSMWENLGILLPTHGKIEKSIYFDYDETQYKARPDVFIDGVVLDVKTTNDASYRAFQSSSVSYGYFLQAGMIRLALESIGINLERFIFACVETAAPFSCAIYVLDEEAIDYGVVQFFKLHYRLKECLNENRWQDYGLKVLTVPGWAKVEA